MRRAVAVGCAAVLAASCEQPRTELVVRVDSELAWGPGQQVQSVVLTVRREGASGPLRDVRTTALGADGERRPLPLLVGVTAGDDTDTPVWIEALGCGDPNGCTAATAVVAQRAVVRFTRGQTQEVTLLLASACVGVTCASDQRCEVSSGRCEAATRAQETVRPFSGIDAATATDRKLALDLPDGADADTDDAPDTTPDVLVAMDVAPDAVALDSMEFMDLGMELDAQIDVLTMDAALDQMSPNDRLDAVTSDVPFDRGMSDDRPALADMVLPSVDVPIDATLSDGGMCIAGGRACVQGSTACCGGFSCGAEPAGTLCCHPAMGSCTTSLDCCGQMLCNIASGQSTGTCACRRRNEVCMGNLDCCGGARCNMPDGGTTGTCACSREFEACTSSEGCCDGLSCRSGRCVTTGCFAPGERCDNSDAGTCCGGYACNIQPSGQSTCCRGPALTTSEPPVPCTTGAECCGSVLCTGGVCVCRRGGEPCYRDGDCCGAMVCNRPGGGSSGMGMCHCQQREQYCRTGGNDCCSGLSCVNNTCR